MTTEHFDALVVGAGPAGSVAALVLARGGARVALVDKAAFPRDKACGDVIGPRGVQTLAELGIELDAPRVGDLDVVGPTGRRARLPALPGLTYPDHGLVVPRRQLDERLRREAIDAGAVPVAGRAADPLFDDGGELRGFSIDQATGPLRLSGDVVVGADGATSRVATAAGLVNAATVLWGFALRVYLPGNAPWPRIYFWEPSPWSGYPGYGWVFPGTGGTVNAGLGIAARGDRRIAARAAKDLPGFVASAGLDPAAVHGRPLGGWLKLGMTGTTPARRRTLLVGDAAGLVNPLQGEGIAQALGSGRCAAAAILTGGPDGAAERYKAALSLLYAPYACTTAPLTAWMLRHPRAVAGAGRVLTHPAVAAVVSDGWSLYWSDLLDGARPGAPRRVASMATWVTRLLTARSDDRRRVVGSLDALDSLGEASPPEGA